MEAQVVPQTPQQAAGPRIWLLLGDKKGDNGQVYALAEALAWPWEKRHIQVRDEFVFGKPKVGPTLYHINLDRSDPLEPPWPDLILTIGRRPANVALWIKEQSGGRSRIILVGKPSGMMEHFDLIVASSENILPPLPNVVPISLPLMRVNEAALATATTSWRKRLMRLPRPLIAVMVGGPTGPYLYDHSDAGRIIAVADDVLSQGGTPYIATSRRTPPLMIQALQEHLPAGSHSFFWNKHSNSEDNPYLGLMGCADGFIVTADSISMMTEVVRLHRPLAILSLSTGVIGAMDHLRRSLTRRFFASADGCADAGIRGYLGRLAYRSGLITHTRDFGAFHQMLIDRGLAVLWTGGSIPSPKGDGLEDEVSGVARRIHTLLEQNRQDGLDDAESH